MENLEFNFASPVVFKLELSAHSQRIHETALFRAKRYLVAEADLLMAIIEVDRDRTFEKFGLTHLSPYCVKYLGLSEDVAANFVRVARKTLEVPELKDAVDEGLSVTKAKTIASVVTPQNHGAWIEKAKTLSKDKLEREVAEASPNYAKPEKAKVHKKTVRFEFELSHEDAAAFRRAQDLVSQKLGKSATLAETQVEIMKLFLKTKDPVQKAKRQREPSRNRSPQRKKIKAAVLHEVNARDQGECQVQLPDGTRCKQTRWIHLHHIKPKAHGGADSAENLITLCSAHHRLWHA